MKPTKEQVEEVAMAMHEGYRIGHPATKAWRYISVRWRDVYRSVAPTVYRAAIAAYLHAGAGNRGKRAKAK